MDWAWIGYLVSYTLGMICMALAIALMSANDNNESSEYQKALEGQLKKANTRGNELKVSLDEAMDLANHALLSYALVAEEADYKEMCVEHWEHRCLVAEVLSEFE